MTGLGGYVVKTGADGVLETPTTEVDQIIEALRGERRVVLHFHGGLVDEKAGMRAAEGLISTYEGAGAYPVFFIWRSGIFDILSGNLREIASERAFDVLRKWVLKFAVGKLRQAVGLAPKGAPLPTPSDHEVYLEIDRAKAGEEPYAYDDAIASATPEDLSEAEATELEARLRDDPELQVIGVEIAESALPEEVRTASRGVTVTERKSEKTLMSPEVVEELQREARVPEGQKGLLTSAALARRGVKVLGRVIGRFRSDTDHGLYPRSSRSSCASSTWPTSGRSSGGR